MSKARKQSVARTTLKQFVAYPYSSKNNRKRTNGRNIQIIRTFNNTRLIRHI